MWAAADLWARWRKRKAFSRLVHGGPRSRGQAAIGAASIVRLIGAVLPAPNDEWQLQHRYMQVEAMAELAAAGAGEPKQIPCAA